MRFVLFGTASASPRTLRVGALVGDGDGLVADVSAAAAAAGHAGLASMRVFLEAGAAGRAWAAAALADASLHVKLGGADGLVLRAPIYDPSKVICVGMNYVDHCTEVSCARRRRLAAAGWPRRASNLAAAALHPRAPRSRAAAQQNMPIPVEPVLFNKFPTSIIGNGEPLVRPPETEQFDFEVELVIVIGAAARRVSAADAMAHVAGYTVAHDVSARDLQLKKNGGQWMLGKCIDGFAPLGPSIVTPDAVGDVHALRLRCLVNGVVMQDGNTKELVHNVPAIIAYASKFMTLLPGDIILTGTPPGVGCFRKPPVWLKAGDVVTCEIEKLGSITNTVVDEVVKA